MHLNDAGEMTSSVDPDQIAPSGAVWPMSTMFVPVHKFFYVSFPQEKKQHNNKWNKFLSIFKFLDLWLSSGIEYHSIFKFLTFGLFQE